MRAYEFITEELKFRPEQLGPMTGMRRYDGLDNSNPYHMWRFLVAAAGQPTAPGQKPLDKEGPIGQKMSTLAYSSADAEILAATAKAMGQKSTEISSQDSTEPDFVQKVSPVKGFKGYPR